MLKQLHKISQKQFYCITNNLKNKNLHSPYNSQQTINWNQFESVLQIQEFIGKKFPIDLSLTFLKNDYLQIISRINNLKINSDISYLTKLIKEYNDKIEFILENKESLAPEQDVINFLIDILQIYQYILSQGYTCEPVYMNPVILQFILKQQYNQILILCFQIAKNERKYQQILEKLHLLGENFLFITFSILRQNSDLFPLVREYIQQNIKVEELKNLNQIESYIFCQKDQNFNQQYIFEIFINILSFDIDYPLKFSTITSILNKFDSKSVKINLQIIQKMKQCYEIKGVGSNSTFYKEYFLQVLILLLEKNIISNIDEARSFLFTLMKDILSNQDFTLNESNGLVIMNMLKFCINSTNIEDFFQIYHKQQKFQTLMNQFIQQRLEDLIQSPENLSIFIQNLIKLDIKNAKSHVQPLKNQIKNALEQYFLGKKIEEIQIKSIETFVYIFRMLWFQIENQEKLKELIEFYKENMTVAQLTAFFYLLATKDDFIYKDTVLKSLSLQLEKKKDDLQANQVHLILKTLPFISEIPKFLIFLTSLIQEKANNPQYSNNICDFIFYNMKIQRKRIQFYQPLLEKLQIALNNSTEYIDLFNLSRLVKQISKFDEFILFKELLIKKIIQKQKEDIEFISTDQLSFVYQVVISNLILDSKDQVKQECLQTLGILENQIIKMIQIGNFRNFDIGRIIIQQTICFNSIQRHEFLQYLLDMSLKQNFFDNQNLDIGLFSMIFWAQSVLQYKDYFINFFSNHRQNLEKIILAASQTKINHIINKKFGNDLKYSINDIQMNQFQEALYFGQELSINQEIKQFCSNQLDILEKNSYFDQKQKQKITQQNTLSFFEQQVTFNLKQVIKSDLCLEYRESKPFQLDIYIPEINTVVECNGQQHYVNKKLKNNYLKKVKILQKRGYKVALIGIREWNNLKAQERCQYLKQILNL